MEQSIYELYMEQVNPQDTREIMQAEDTLTALLKLVENRELRDAHTGFARAVLPAAGVSEQPL